MNFPLAVQNALLEQARGAEPGAWQSQALTILQSQIGFDGAVWGAGTVDARGQLTMARVHLWGRDSSLLSDYGAVAEHDPVTQSYLSAPASLQVVDCQKFYARAADSGVRTLLHQHQIAHLALLGIKPLSSDQRAWMTLYRSEARSPFSEHEQDLMQTLIPLTLTLDQLRQPAVPLAWVDVAQGSESRNGAGDRSEPNAWRVCTPQERRVLAAYSRGLSYKEVARELGMAPETVRTHVRNAYRKLGVTDKAAMARRMVGAGVGGESA